MRRVPFAFLLAGLSAGAVLAAPTAHAQLPSACAPAPVGEALAPLPFPNPFPPGRLHPASEHDGVVRPAGAFRPDGRSDPARGTGCAREARVSAWAGSGWGEPLRVTTAGYQGERLVVLDEAEDGGGGLEPTWRTSFSYSGSGRLSRRQRERYVDGAFVLSSRTVYTYDGRGFLASATEQAHNGTGWRNESRSLLSFDAGPYAYELISEFWEDGAWVRTARLFYEHTPDNRLLVQSSFQAEGPDWLTSYRERFTYDDAGRLVEHAFDNGTGSDWELAFRTVFAYDGTGRLMAADAQEWFGEDWIPYASTGYAYDAEGRLGVAAHSTVRPGGTMLEPYARERFEYDPDGRLAVASDDLPDGAAWQPDQRHWITWDADRVRTRESQRVAGGEWTYTEQLVLTYAGTVGDAPGAFGVGPRLTVGPSPARRATTVRLALDAPAAVAVRVVDVRGRVVGHVAAGEVGAGMHAWSLDTSRLAVGVYAVEARMGGHRLTERLVVVR